MARNGWFKIDRALLEKPEFSALRPAGQIFVIYLIGNADAAGSGRLTISYTVRSLSYAIRRRGGQRTRLLRMLYEASTAIDLHHWEEDGHLFYCLPGWSKYQSTNGLREKKWPPCPTCKLRTHSEAASYAVRGEKVGEVKEKEEKARTRATPAAAPHANGAEPTPRPDPKTDPKLQALKARQDRLLARYEPDEIDRLRDALAKCAEYRKRGKIAPAIVVAILEQLDRYEIAIVMDATLDFIHDKRTPYGNAEKLWIGFVRQFDKNWNANQEERIHASEEAEFERKRQLGRNREAAAKN